MSYIATKNSITLYSDGQIFSIANGHPHFEQIIGLLKTGEVSDFESAVELANIAKQVKEKIKEQTPKGLHVQDGHVYYQDRELHGALARRIVAMIDEGYNLSSMSAFAKNLLGNPSYRAQHELYTFLEANSLPITEDGCFMAYKRINENWTDVYSRKISNHIGARIAMPRHAVNDDCTKTCSPGLHVASLEYLKYYRGDRLVAVKVNPADVVSVPTDYNNSKMRVCCYIVMKELDISLVQGTEDWTEYQRSVYKDYEDDDESDDESDESEDDS